MYDKIWAISENKKIFLLISFLFWFAAGAATAALVLAFVGTVSVMEPILWGVLTGWLAGLDGGILYLYRTFPSSY